RGRNADNKLLLFLVDICIGTVRIVNNLGKIGRASRRERVYSSVQAAVLIREQHRVGSTLLDLNYERVARSTVASNCDKITALDSNACIGNILDVLFDGFVCIGHKNVTRAGSSGVGALNDRGRNADNKLLLFLVDICIGTVRIVNNLGNGLVGLNDVCEVDDMCITGLVYVCKLCTIVINVSAYIGIP